MATTTKMKYIYYLLAVIFVSCAGNQEKDATGPTKIDPNFTEYPIDCSIRALEVIDPDHVWFAGSGGMFGWTADGGDHWTIDSIKIDNNTLEFRAIAVTNSAVFILNVGSPAYLLKSSDQGQNWHIVYQEHHPDIFYDSMKFWDDENGIAIGDPIEGCLSVIITRDGGNNWRKLDCSELPASYEGEAAYAASNTNIAVVGDHVWVASGGKKARVFHSGDKGMSWKVFDTPIIQGGKMTGIFTMDFIDENRGVIFGGDWENQHNNVANKAVTRNGGQNWQLINDGIDPGYRSCVQYISNSDGNAMLAIGIPGISYTADGGKNWQHFDNADFYTIRIAQSGNVAWMAGKNKIGRMDW